jgi:beta-mannosidase
VNVTNDLLVPFKGQVRWSLVELNGKQLATGTADVEVSPQSCAEICAPELEMAHAQRRKQVFIAELYQNGVRMATNLVTFVPNKHLELVDPDLQAAVTRKGNELSISVKASSSLARFVELSFEGVDVVFSDNYFDVPAGTSVIISCPVPEGWSLGRLRKALRLRSLRDSF